MKWIYGALLCVLGAIFLRADVQLVDIVTQTHLTFAMAAALFLGGILAGQILTGHKAPPETRRYAFWGIFVVSLLALLEYSVEWQRSTVIAENETVILSAASVETAHQHFITASDGLYFTEARFNGTEAAAMIDTGASLVLLNHATAQAAGINLDSLVFDTPVTTASGPFTIALTTLDEIRVGPGILATNVAAAVTPQGLNHTNLLGVSFLSQLDETTVRKTQMILTQRR